MYAGVTSDHNALPGVTIIGRDGRVVFRRVGSAKDDRMPVAELLATLDSTLGTSGPGAATGFAAIDRAQLRLAVGGGATHTGSGFQGTAVGDLGVLFPLGRYVLLGPWLSFEPRHAPLDLDGALVLRAPFWHATGAVELGVTGGWTASGATGWNAGGRAGIWFAITPSFSVQLGAGITAHEGGNTAVVATLGLAHLFRLH